MRRAFTLVELLVVVAVVALLISLLLPALGAARETGRSVACLSNHRQMAFSVLAYSNDNRGVGPAIGQPYGSHPNWALVIQSDSGKQGSTPGELYARRSVLVCPTVDAFYPEDMTRTYAMNATGHAGAAFGDPDDYDDPVRPGHIRFDRGAGIARPGETPLFVDSAVASFPSGAPPPTRTASVIDFRQPEHVASRLGLFHDGRRSFNAAMLDGSAHMQREIRDHWKDRLP